MKQLPKGPFVNYVSTLGYILSWSVKYLGKILAFPNFLSDVRHQGFLNTFSLNYFFRDILIQMEKLNQDPVKFEDVKDEIFDMVRPLDPLRIKLDDLIKSGNGDTVVSILIDLNGFWTYENREVLVNDNNDESSSPSE